MSKIDILSQHPISMAQAKEELEAIKKRDTELNFRGQKTEEYLLSFSLHKKNAEEVYKKIEDLAIPRMKPEHIIKIIDLAPSTLEELKCALQGYTLTITAENLKKIVTIIEENVKK